MSNHQFNQHTGTYEHLEVQDHVSIHIGNMLCSVPPTLPEYNIFRVRHQLRRVNEKAYDPEILAIGPYHYGNDKFKFMEEQKLRYLQQLLKRRNEGSVDRYMPTLREQEQPARNCYAETIDLSQEKFLAMMLIDGCFIIEMFRNITRDLLLLENQLPLFVLSKLYDLTKGPDEHHEFSKVAIMYFEVEREGPGRNLTIGSREHLLHLYHTWRTSGWPKTPRLNCTPIMPSAIELRESGVRFRDVQEGQLSDIKFKNGTFELPVLYVKYDTESKFRNLIAYEQHRQTIDINYFTDYVTLIDCLINSSKDVEVLRHAGIIKNYLGDDKVVAEMFNKIGNYVPVCDSYYSEIFQNVKAHCNKRRNIWMAKLRREYFHSPWAFLSVLAAIVLLFLTAAQTAFTILPYTK
ncbi:hypothetical protein ACJRO7_031594 [Eucalyptus globulus]|uniref:Uncharacterized protein n=1 Tax=Eucalyptus globulus TaxID=34317 RepID=A0ABD3JT92_EUCGL